MLPGEKISWRDFIHDLVESLRTKYVTKLGSLRLDSESNDLPPPKRRTCVVKG